MLRVLRDRRRYGGASRSRTEYTQITRTCGSWEDGDSEPDGAT